MAVVLKEQLELRPSVALQKKVGLKSLEQVIRWGDRVNQELCRWRKLEDKKCWRARARRIRKRSRGGSSGLSKAQALVKPPEKSGAFQRTLCEGALRRTVTGTDSCPSHWFPSRSRTPGRPPVTAGAPHLLQRHFAASVLRGRSMIRCG